MEKAFSDLAYATVQNNCGPLMKDQYRVGFEIVHKSDDQTRMVGIFVFRVNRTNQQGGEKFYAPVFFINGNIKGNSLLYRVAQKRFVPATNDWCEYLVSLASAPEGEGVPISDRRTMRNQMNLIDIVEPPLARGSNMSKYAGFQTHDNVEGTLHEWLESVRDAEDPKESILREFIEQDGGFNALHKIANTIEKDEEFEFAQALVKLCDPDNYMPQLSVREKIAAHTEPLLVWNQGLLDNPNVKSASVADMAKGYIIEDFRKEAHLNDVVFAEMSSSLESVTEPGIYNVLLADGSERKMLVGYYEELDVARDKYRNEAYSIPYSVASDGLHVERGADRNIVLIDTTNHYSKKVCLHNNRSSEGVPMGWMDGDVTADTVGKEKPEKGKAYRIFNAKNKSFSEPFWVTEVKDSNGITEVSCTDSRLNDAVRVEVWKIFAWPSPLSS